MANSGARLQACLNKETRSPSISFEELGFSMNDMQPLRIHLHPILFWGAADLLFEHLAEVFHSTEADYLRDLRQLKMGILQQQLVFLDPDGNIIRKINAVLLLKFARDVFAAAI